jgi:transposase
LPGSGTFARTNARYGAKPCSGTACERGNSSSGKRALDTWLIDAEQSGMPELRGFAAGIRRDLGPVAAALRWEWSNGQTEGQVNRLKTLKRAMYGRAKLDLLRLRLLYAA